MTSDLQRLELSFRPLRLQLSALILQWHWQDAASSAHFLPLQGRQRALGAGSGEVEGGEGEVVEGREGKGEVGGEEDGEMLVGGGDGRSRENGGERVGVAWVLNSRERERSVS